MQGWNHVDALVFTIKYMNFIYDGEKGHHREKYLWHVGVVAQYDGYKLNGIEH